MKALWYLGAGLFGVLALVALGGAINSLISDGGLAPRQLGVIVGCLLLARGALRKGRERRLGTTVRRDADS